MTLTEYLERGAARAESVAELARIIGTTREHASAAKSMRKPLPLDAAIRLADYINADRIKVISANELATEKKEEKRAFWNHIAKAASIALAFGFVTNFVTLDHAEATPRLNALSHDLYYVKSRMKASLEKRHLFRIVLKFIERILEAFKTFFPRRIAQI